jgi:hypothetical protein
VEWGAVAERARARYERAGTAVLRGNVGYATGLALLMAGSPDEARGWFERAAWGRPIGVVKALLLAGDDEGASAAAEWALSLGCEDAESPIGRYAATLALLTLGRFEQARPQAGSLRERDDFPRDVADALASIAAGDLVAYAEAAASVLASFETRDQYLEGVAVADTLLVLHALAARRGIAPDLPESPVLPA